MMSSEAIWRSLDCRLLTPPLVVRLYRESRIGPDDVVRIEEERLARGCELDQIEEQLALLLSDQLWDVPMLVDTWGEQPLQEHLDRQVYLWIRLMEVRAAWDSLEAPQFYLEELLDHFDPEGDYEQMRFFRSLPRRELSPDKYVARVDATLEQMRARLNAQPTSGHPDAQ